MKKISLIILFIISIFTFSPVCVNALTINNTNVSNYIYLLDDDTNLDDQFEEYDQVNDCKLGILGDPSDPNSVGWLLQKVLNIARIAVCILVVLLSSFDFAKVIIDSDDEKMKKATKKLTTRIILIIVLFLAPTLVNVVLNIFGFIGDPTCGLR